MRQLGISMSVLEIEKDIKNIDLNDILKAVSEVCNIEIRVMKSKKRNRDYVTARHLFFYIAHKYTKTQLEVIGKALNCSHATVLHGCKKIENQLIYKDISWLVNKIENQLTKTNK
jgi:chromosomal replication initiation ATPase DnaA